MTELMEKMKSRDVEPRAIWEWMEGAISDSKRDP